MKEDQKQLPLSDSQAWAAYNYLVGAVGVIAGMEALSADARAMLQNALDGAERYGRQIRSKRAQV